MVISFNRRLTMSKAEEFILKNTKALKESNGKEYFKWLTPDQAKEAIEIAREEIYEWLEKNAHKYATIGIYIDAMIIDLKQVIKDK